MPITHIVLKTLSIGNGQYLKPGQEVDASGYRNLPMLEQSGPDAYLRRIQEQAREQRPATSAGRGRKPKARTRANGRTGRRR